VANELMQEEVAACEDLARAVLRFLVAHETGRQKRTSVSGGSAPVRPAWVPLAGRISPEKVEEAKLLLSTREAAKLLGISDRSLWNLTAPRGPVPAIRFGSIVRYSPDDLRAWIKQSRQEGPAS
jgi:excisionase family DNA binding protein